MTPQISSRFATCLVALLAAVAALILSLRKPAEVSSFIEEALTKGWISERYEPLVRSSTSAIVGPSEFPRGININRRPSNGALNIIIVNFPAQTRSGVRERFPEFVGTIAYLGHPSLVLIDEIYLERVAERLGFLSFEGNPYIRSASNELGLRRLLLWVLGHELGHMRSAHRARHFLPAAIERLSGYTARQYAEEVDADQAFARRLSQAVRDGRMSQEDITDFGMDLAALANSELMRTMGISTKEGPMILFFDPSESVPIGTDSHPEFFLRAVRILGRLDLPQSSPLQAIQRDMQRFEKRLQPVPAHLGRVIIEGEPAAAEVLVYKGNMQLKEYRIPAEIWLPGGVYSIVVRQPEHRSFTRDVQVTEGKVEHVRVRLDHVVDRTTSDPLGVHRWEIAQAHLANARSYVVSEPTRDAALWELARARDSDPTWSLPVMMEAELRLQLGETGDARRLYETALELAPRERPWQRASRYQVMKLATALEQAAAPPTDAEAYVEAQLEGADWSWLMDEPDLAEKHLFVAAARLPADPRILNLRALLATDRGDLSGAERLAREAARLGSWEARQTVARILEKASRSAEAERELRNLARDRPGDPDSLRDLAEYYQRREQWDAALAAYRRASEIDPDVSHQWCEIGSLYQQLGDPRAAEQAFRRPGVTSPVSCMLGLAKLYASRGQREQALSICGPRGVRFEPDELSLLAECEGDVLTSSGDTAGAAAAYRGAVWFDPLRTGSRQKLAKADATLGAADGAALHTWVVDRLEQLPRR